jgi:hypothetical protein
MRPLGLDGHGQRVLRDFADSPECTPSDLQLIEQVLQAVAWKQGLSREWHSEQDAATGDWYVRPRTGLLIVVRIWTGEQSQEFSLVYIGPDSQPG